MVSGSPPGLNWCSWRSNRNLHGALLSAASVVSTVPSVLLCAPCHRLRLSTDLQCAVRPLDFPGTGNLRAPIRSVPGGEITLAALCVLSTCLSETVGQFISLYVTVYSCYAKKRAPSLHPVLKGSAPNWVRTTDTPDSPLDPVPSGSFL